MEEKLQFWAAIGPIFAMSAGGGIHGAEEHEAIGLTVYNRGRGDDAWNPKFPLRRPSGGDERSRRRFTVFFVQFEMERAQGRGSSGSSRGVSSRFLLVRCRRCQVKDEFES